MMLSFLDRRGREFGEFAVLRERAGSNKHNTESKTVTFAGTIEINAAGE
ncbi:hypothetical protein HJC23_013683 [Cyclotella cryptica]|uniref:Uncharacterized protein n=1 Tax=Cyclotella cryptica TaxID=29204 RepID=A0ABD3QW44_9STRA